MNLPINLPTVTLLLATSINIEQAINAILRTSSNIIFAQVKLLSHEEPSEKLPGYIEHVECPKFSDIDDYNYFMFKDAYKYTETPHILVIQPDSWAINPHLWDDKWLEYDYIGAPWAVKNDAYICHETGEHVRVGNGGFSLRSRKLMMLPDFLGLPILHENGFYNEDGNLCVYHRKKLLKSGVNYAPVEVAAKFSFETPVPENEGIKPFGFHKHFHEGLVE